MGRWQAPGGVRAPYWAAAAVFVTLVCWGIHMYSRQFAQGLGVTGLNRPVFWGLYIANFIFCVGLSAGGIAVSALVHLLDKKEMKPIAIMSEILAASLLVLAASFIIMDLGRPLHMYNLFLHPHVESPAVVGRLLHLLLHDPVSCAVVLQRARAVGAPPPESSVVASAGGVGNSGPHQPLSQRPWNGTIVASMCLRSFPFRPRWRSIP